MIEANRRDDYMPYWATLWPGPRSWPGSSTGLRGRVIQSCWNWGRSRAGRIGSAGPGQPSRLQRLRSSGCGSLPLQRGAQWTPGSRGSGTRLEESASAAVLGDRGCEVTYDHKLHEALLTTLEAMLAPNGVCWLGDPGRFWSTHFSRQPARNSASASLIRSCGKARSLPRRRFKSLNCGGKTGVAAREPSPQMKEQGICGNLDAATPLP